MDDKYAESMELVNDRLVEKWVSHKDYLQRIRDLVKREADTTNGSTVRGEAPRP